MQNRLQNNSVPKISTWRNEIAKSNQLKMKIVRGIENFCYDYNTCITIGTFDGLHIGHQQILSTLTNIAKNNNLKSVAITFDPHPRQILMPDKKVNFVLTQHEKIKAFEKIGIDFLIIHPFSKEFAALSAREFLKDILCGKLNMKHLIKGFNNHFGKDRLSDISVIKQYGKEFGFDVTEVNKRTLNGISASSTVVREMILSGDVEKAAMILNYKFMFTGIVVHGKHLGSQIGFPTANISIEDNNKIIPKAGVYAATTTINGKQYDVMLNIGSNPTVNADNTKTFLEAHIVDFSGDIYGKEITLELYKRIRDEHKFASIDELKQQLTKDKLMLKTILHQTA